MIYLAQVIAGGLKVEPDNFTLYILIGVVASLLVGLFVYIGIRRANAAKAPVVDTQSEGVVCYSAFPVVKEQKSQESDTTDIVLPFEVEAPTAPDEVVLVVKRALNNGKEITAEIPSAKIMNLGGALNIGRAESADLRFNETCISRNHARIGLEGKSFYVMDMGSANGTAQNGRAIAPHKKVLLHSGDTLSFGGVKIKIMMR